jgi:Protein of unknown function (DUF2786)
MSDINTIEKIKKLLRLGQPNSGATDAEAHAAMQMASALMLKHNIEVNLDDDRAQGATQGQFRLGYDATWHYECASAAGLLYSCRLVISRGTATIAFVGRADNIQACEITTQYLCAEVERLYKVALPKGMSKEERAEYRRSFKFACGRRIAARAWAIMETLRNDDLKAIEATGSRALVIVESIDAQLAEADAMLASMGVKVQAVKAKRVGTGTIAGQTAGDSVELQKKVGT